MDSDDRMGWGFGYVLLAGIFVLAGLFGLKHVEEASSYGLKDLLGLLKDLLLFWAGWKFNTKVNGLK